MTTLNIAHPPSASERRAFPGHLLAAAALLLLLGVPALLAPASQVDPQDWHGNSAGSEILR